MAFLEAFIKTKSRGMIIGKLNIAIKELLLEAFDAIALVSVKVDESPTEPKSNTKKYMSLS